MLYSICSMQFWINKSNLVCAENDLSTHLCFWLHFTLARKIYSLSGKLPSENLWISWQIAASSSCEKSSVSFGFRCYRLLNSFCTSPLRARQASAGVAVVESPFYLKQMARDLAKTNSTWAKVMSSLRVKWTWLGDGRPGLMIPLILKHFFFNLVIPQHRADAL